MIENKKIYNELILEQSEMYIEKLEELQLQIESLNEKQHNEQEIVYNNNENKIINLGKFFNNKRKGERVFSIYEPIKYEDLEKLAVDVIQLNDDETKYFNNLAK